MGLFHIPWGYQPLRRLYGSVYNCVSGIVLGPANRLGGHCVAVEIEATAGGVYERHGRNDVPKSSKILPYVRQGMLHRLPH